MKELTTGPVYSEPGWARVPGVMEGYWIHESGTKAYSQRSGRYLDIHDKPDGYKYFWVKNEADQRRQILVHRGVYAAHVAPLVEGMTINHIDHNKRNNAVSNLEQITHRENIQKSMAAGQHQTGSRNGRAKLVEADVLNIDARLKAGESVAVLAARYNVTKRAITKIESGDNWSAVTGRQKTHFSYEYKRSFEEKYKERRREVKRNQNRRIREAARRAKK